jgi:hypothetical protein
MLTLGSGGEVHVCGALDARGYVQTLDAATGALRWAEALDGACVGMVALGALVVVATPASVHPGPDAPVLFAYGRDGALRWSLGAPALGPSGWRALATDGAQLVGVSHHPDPEDRAASFTQVTRIDATGTILGSQRYAANAHIRALAVASGVLALGGEDGSPVDLGGGLVLPSRPSLATDYDALIARLPLRR